METEYKICSKCKQKKMISEFYKRTDNHKIQTYCKACQSEYSKSHYRNNRDSYFNRNYDRRKRLIKFVIDYLSERKCVDCGESDVRCLEFDHIHGEKLDNVTMIAHQGLSMKRLVSEIEKCEVRCSNCHRKRHWKNTMRGIS